MTEFGEWQKMATAPKDGTRVLVAVRASEQGPAEVDVARWARPAPSAEKCWVAADSDPGAVVAYEEAELFSWMPLPAPIARRRPEKGSSGWPKPPEPEEMGGSGI
jgi:hypothetical protein